MNQRCEISSYRQFFRSADDADGDVRDDCNNPIDFRNQHQRQLNVKQNKIEKILNKALQKSVDLSKGESMMKKMGWCGGGLGRLGEGILEPIAPNAAYATMKQGLGISEVAEMVCQESFSHLNGNEVTMAGMEQQEDYLMPNISLLGTKLLTNYTKRHSKKTLTILFLEKILDFVLNEKQHQLLLDKNLSKKKRKLVHNLVGKINSNTLYSFTGLQEDLIQHIIELNEYDLHTKSSGKASNRQLAIYKHAKDYMYLVTPQDLRADVDVENYDLKQQTLSQRDINSQNICQTLSKELTIKLRKKLPKEETTGPNTFSVEEVLKRIVELFMEFISDDNVTDFRFLGSFNEAEYEAVGTFFDICDGDMSENSEVANKIRQGIQSDKYYYSLGKNSYDKIILLKEEMLI